MKTLLELSEGWQSRTKQISLLVFVLCVFANAPSAAAATLVTFDNLGQCNVLFFDWLRQGYTFATPLDTYDSRLTDQFVNGREYHLQRKYVLLAPPELGGGPTFECFEGKIWFTYFDSSLGYFGTRNDIDPFANPETPARISQMCEIGEHFCNGIFLISVTPICRVITLACGARSYIGLEEQSPSWGTARTAYSELPENVRIAFKVLDAGDGDEIALAINGVEFFFQPLSAFNINKINLVDVPSGLLIPDMENIWTFDLVSKGDQNAIIEIFDVRFIEDSVELLDILLQRVEDLETAPHLVRLVRHALQYHVGGNEFAACSMISAVPRLAKSQARLGTISHPDAIQLQSDVSIVQTALGCTPTRSIVAVQ